MTKIKSAAWELSASLKRVQLQSIATSIGAPVSGTKPQLLSGIHEIINQTSNSLLQEKPTTGRNASTRNLRVLSIDMGIRNLAFAFLTCEVAASTGKGVKSVFSKPELRQWRRIELFKVGQTIRSAERDRDTNGISASIGEMESQLDVNDASTAVALEESFEPPVLAKHAYTFAKYCAGLRPTHILIERQRFRTGGHTAVLEWALRVGMLESMLHSTFHTFKEEGILSDVSVEPILPMRVNKFWFADQEELLTDAYAEGLLERKGNKEAKLAKIAIVGKMLKQSGANSGPFSVHVDAKLTVSAFLSRSTPRSGTRKATALLEKLDDVADSLLQGLAWLKWQENRRSLVTTSAAD